MKAYTVKRETADEKMLIGVYQDDEKLARSEAERLCEKEAGAAEFMLYEDGKPVSRAVWNGTAVQWKDPA